MPGRLNRSLRGLRLAIVLFTTYGCSLATLPEVALAPQPDLSPLEPLTTAEIEAAAIFLRLADRREFSTAIIEAGTRSMEAATRESAAMAAGRIGGPEAPASLRRLVSDPDTAVAAAAAFMIGQLRDSIAVPGLIPLIDTVAAGLHPSVAAEVAAALGKIGGDPARAALTDFLLAANTADSRLYPAVREAIIGSWRAGDARIEPLERWVNSPDPEIRWRVAYVLVRRESPDALPLLLSLTSDPDPITRSVAVRGLGSSMVTARGASRTAILDTLLAAANDSLYEVRIEATRVLGTYPDPPALALLDERLFSGSPHEAIAAMEALTRGDPEQADRAIARLRQFAHLPDTPEYLREVAISSAAAIDMAGAAAWIDALATDPAWRIRRAVARALGARGTDGLPGIYALARDPDPRVAAAATDAVVTRFGPDELHAVRPFLLEMLQHHDGHVRAAALRGFALVGDLTLFPILLDAFDRARADRENDAALAAIDAIADLGRRFDFPAERAFFARFPRPDDHLVRQKAASRFGDASRVAWGEPYPIDTFTIESVYRRHIFDWRAPPPPLRRLPRVQILTEAGLIEAILFGDLAPTTVASFLNLANGGFFDGQEWARVVPNFVVQGGDPRGDTSGGPGYTIRDELNRARFEAGSLGMALAGPDTGGSQFFISLSPQPHLDGVYTVFGSVVEGHEVLERILPGDWVVSIREIIEEE